MAFIVLMAITVVFGFAALAWMEHDSKHIDHADQS